jgi:hypothetical protein
MARVADIIVIAAGAFAPRAMRYDASHRDKTQNQGAQGKHGNL